MKDFCANQACGMKGDAMKKEFLHKLYQKKRNERIEALKNAEVVTHEDAEILNEGLRLKNHRSSLRQALQLKSSVKPVALQPTSITDG